MRYFVTYTKPGEPTEKKWQGVGADETEVIAKFKAKGLEVQSIRPVVEDIQKRDAVMNAIGGAIFGFFGVMAIMLGGLLLLGNMLNGWSLVSRLGGVPPVEFLPVICGFLCSLILIIWGFGVFALYYAVRIVWLLEEIRKQKQA